MTILLKRPKVAVVFATMNRCDVAVGCIRAIAGQSMCPYKVYVADNVSDDGTADVLDGLCGLPFPLIVLRMDANLGNAGGVSAAMELAFSEGADAVWILDDDSWPNELALEAMIEGGLHTNVVRHALQIDPRTNRFTWPLQIFTSQRGWHLIWNLHELPDQPIIPSRISWTGALLPKHVRDVVGMVNQALFIRGEDEEYPWRIEKAGFVQEAVRGAILKHPGPVSIVHVSFLGKNFFFECGLTDWKLYYKVRNMVWLKKLQSGPIRSICIALFYVLFTCFHDGICRLPVLKKAILDGWYSRLGKVDVYK